MSAILSQLESDLGPVSGLGRQRTLSPRRGTFFWEATRIALDSIRAHKMRSVLTLLGIIIGVASVVTVGGAIEGLGYLNKGEARGLLELYSHDKEPSVRRAAEAALR